MIRRKYSKDVLEVLVRNSKSVSEVMEGLGLIARGSNYARMRKRIDDLGINTSHFKSIVSGSTWNRRGKEDFKIEVLVKNGPRWASSQLKKRLLKFELLKEICGICGQSPIWNNEILVLQLDHIDGDSRNNRLENLRILCPNCHSQTSTYNIGRKRSEVK